MAIDLRHIPDTSGSLPVSVGRCSQIPIVAAPMFHGYPWALQQDTPSMTAT